jgi:hypothetical protein
MMWPDFASMHFKNPELLWLLLLVPVIIVYFWKIKKKSHPNSD